MKASLTLIVLFGGVGLAAAANGAGPTDAEVAVERALEFLQVSQASDGAWRVRNTKNAAITGLAVMAFLSAGHVPGEGPYGDVVEKGIRWVLGAQKPNGVISTDVGQTMMYQHGICTLMLAEVAGMTNDRLGAEVRHKLERGVEVILQAQRTLGPDAGGWRYQLRGSDSDISVTGWQVMALRASKNLGCDVQPQRIDLAVDYIQRCRHPATGGFGYMQGNQPTVACTGTSVLALEICGKEQHGKPELQKAGTYILKHPPWTDRHLFYAIYYCTQAMYQLGDNFWNAYRPRLHDWLLRMQRTNGSWDTEAVGRDYCTAMAVLALTVDYGFLPIYQRGEEPAAKQRN
jgi:prenyltransferase beta subunit